MSSTIYYIVYKRNDYITYPYTPMQQDLWNITDKANKNWNLQKN